MPSTRIASIFFATAFLLFASEAPARAPQQPSADNHSTLTLPAPTGPFAIGKVTVHWSDESRIEPLSSDHAPRELMVDIWYPAEPSAAPSADYLDEAAYEKTLGAEGFQKFFGEASETVKHSIRSHAVLRAPFAPSAGRCPVLIFSPGGGMIREVYSAQLEDLASHGYVVAAISHPYDAIVTLFPDGRQIAYSSQRWPAPPSFEGEANLNQLEWHANDIRFVLDQLTLANAPNPSALPFAGHLDLNRVGAFGHSFGGIAAAHTCQLDSRFKACMNQDGVVSKKPVFLDVRGWTMDQPFMFILHDAPTGRLTDDEVAQMKMPRERIEQIVRRLDEYQERTLRSTGKGSYRVRLQSKQVTHMDFSDLPFLGARDPADAKKRAAILAVIRSYTLAFFDQSLRGKPSPLLDQATTSEYIDTVERFPRAPTPCSPH